MQGKSSQFDPYHKWLGISPKDQPPNYYRLLGLELFEADADVIDSAANRQMVYLQTCAAGEHGQAAATLLTEVSSARLCLLNKSKKAAYDASLRVKMGTRTTSPTAGGGGAKPVVSASPPKPVVSASPPKPLGPVPVRPPAAAQLEEAAPDATLAMLAAAAEGASKPQPTRVSVAKKPIQPMHMAIGAGIAVVAIVVGIFAWHGSHSNPATIKETANGMQASGNSKNSLVSGSTGLPSQTSDSSPQLNNIFKPETPAPHGIAAPKPAVVEAPPTPPAVVPVASPQPAPIAPAPPVVAKPLEKFAVPAAAQQTAAGSSLAATIQSSAPDQLIDVAKLNPNPVEAYVLFDQARRKAIQAGQVDKALDAVDEIDKRYTVDALQLKAESVDSSAATSADPISRNAAAQAALALTSSAMQAKRYDLAEKLGADALKLARASGDSEFVRNVTLRVIDIQNRKN